MGMTGDRIHTLTISGDAGLRGAQELVQTLRDATTAHNAVVLAIDTITAADITTIQLLLAARKLAAATGHSLTLATAPTGALRNVLTQLGFLDAEGQSLTADGAFWNPTTAATGRAA